jgi:putative DNA primase/helicase
VRPADIRRPLQVVAQERRYHPVREQLESLVWDGTQRIKSLLVDYFGAEPNAYTPAVGQAFLISMVARVYEPGCKADCCLVLEGPQGIGKSQGLRILAGAEYFCDRLPDLSTKDALIQLRGVWLLEVAEFVTFKSADVAKIKQFLSSPEDQYRPPYGYTNKRFPRQCVIACSVNDANYLRDHTGNRRFWPVACTVINLAGLAQYRDQLWAEAVQLYKQGTPWWLSHEQEQLAAQQQEQRTERDAWEDVVTKYIASCEANDIHEISQEQVLMHALQKPIGTWTRNDQMRVARILTTIGFKRVRGGVDPKGKRPWVYRRAHSGGDNPFEV